jgi:hypothetical protein
MFGAISEGRVKNISPGSTRRIGVIPSLAAAGKKYDRNKTSQNFSHGVQFSKSAVDRLPLNCPQWLQSNNKE